MTWRRPLVAGIMLFPVVLAGGGIVMWSLSHLPPGFGWMGLALLTVASGLFVVKLPGVAATFTVSEAYIFAQILLYGPAAGAITGALDGVVMSFHRRNLGVRRLLFNFAEPAVSVWVAAMTIRLLAGSAEPPHPAALIGATLAGTVVFICTNVGLTGIAVATETGRPPFRAWFRQLPWLAVDYVTGAAVALMIAFTPRPLVWFAIGLTLPILAVVYFTCRSTTERLSDAERHVREVNELYHSTIETLALAVDAKDQVTHGHIRRVQRNAAALARELGIHDEPMLQAIDAAGLLHDMGKLAVPDYLLNKPGCLTDREYEQIKRHATIGADMLSAVKFPYPVVPIVRHHHENWDGTGYPSGLSRSAIPVGARMLAVIDCYDALTSDRPYRPALSPRQAADMIRERSGTKYDPAIVEAFLRIQDSLECAGDARRAAQHPCGIPAPAAAPAATPFRPEDAAAIAQQLLNSTAAELVVCYRHDPSTGELYAALTFGTAAERVRAHRLRTGSGISGWVAMTKSSIRNSDPCLDFGALGGGAVPCAGGSTLAVAVDITRDVSDVITAYTCGRDRFTEGDERLVTLLARESVACAAPDDPARCGRHAAAERGVGVA